MKKTLIKSTLVIITIISLFSLIYSQTQVKWIKLVTLQSAEYTKEFYIGNIEEKDKYYFDGKLVLSTGQWAITNFSTDCKSNTFLISRMYTSEGNIYIYNPQSELTIEKNSPAEAAYNYMCPKEGE